ncbi:MAG: type I restriction-modification system subunit M N-terminal domain-containing protein [Syntrophorhabdaceae bacterium]|nr:type I restriction-modification system subunit M N-terminal domain-containing protein [Syntrophorhabdaceae bacterium]
MAKQRKENNSTEHNGATIGYEAELWKMADTLRCSMDAAEYKHVVLGLIFLKYISDAFEEQHGKFYRVTPAGRVPRARWHAKLLARRNICKDEKELGYGHS